MGKGDLMEAAGDFLLRSQRNTARLASRRPPWPAQIGLAGSPSTVAARLLLFASVEARQY